MNSILPPRKARPRGQLAVRNPYIEQRAYNPYRQNMDMYLTGRASREQEYGAPPHAPAHASLATSTMQFR